ncbi:MAG: hypothetical protein JO314_04885 [Acidobacteria bacterium]|nr:hypothetical protein [Acidobacteriota bacterium]
MKLFRVCLLLLTATVAASVASAQYTGTPVKKDKLLNALRSHQLQTRDIVDAINTAGVDFQVTPDVEQELVAAGARPQVIVAAKANYRAPATVATNPGPKGSNPPGPTKSFSGKPLSKDAIVTLLENGVADAQVRSNVAARGVDFKPTAADKNDIKSAGGSQALINVIGVSYAGAEPNSVGATGNYNTTASAPASRYNELIDQAIFQYDVQKNSAAAIETLKQAIALNPAQPRAYQQVGFAYLYGQKNFDEAESYMKQAIDHGGSAVFRVFHDHGSAFMDTCQGSLFIAKDTVRFESDNNVHTFETADSSIKATKMQNSFLSAFNARRGAFKIELKTGDNDSKNYNFAPLTNDANESKMIIRLIAK